jgi:hypothetical protein
LLILLLTFPLWALPYFLYFRKQPLQPLFQLEAGNLPAPKSLTKRTWILLGAAWGGFMWLFMNVLPLLKDSGHASGWSSALVGLPIWALGGFAFGFLMWLVLGRASKKTNHGEQVSGGNG